MRKFGNSEFSTKPTNYYNLDVIISVGYRVKSQRGTQFRIWATQSREYIIKGFALDDERLQQGGTLGNLKNKTKIDIRDKRLLQIYKCRRHHIEPRLRIMKKSLYLSGRPNGSPRRNAGYVLNYFSVA